MTEKGFTITPAELVTLHDCLSSKICVNIFLKNPTLNISAISRKTGCTNSDAIKHLKNLAKLDSPRGVLRWTPLCLIVGQATTKKRRTKRARHLRELMSYRQIVEKLECTEGEADQAIARALQLYPDLREVKIFSRWRYYYHASLSEEDLRAALAMQENYIRMTRGRANRVGHNWEACVEWFIDTFTRGAEFQTQEHRTRGMDPGRITLHLIKPVGGRRQNAEVDRVWTVTPGVFAQPITYVLECK
jgi:hypothetical protein